MRELRDAQMRKRKEFGVKVDEKWMRKNRRWRILENESQNNKDEKRNKKKVQNTVVDVSSKKKKKKERNKEWK